MSRSQKFPPHHEPILVEIVEKHRSKSSNVPWCIISQEFNERVAPTGPFQTGPVLCKKYHNIKARKIRKTFRSATDELNANSTPVKMLMKLIEGFHDNINEFVYEKSVQNSPQADPAKLKAKVVALEERVKEHSVLIDALRREIFSLKQQQHQQHRRLF